MKTEFEKMRSQEFYDFSDHEIDLSLKHAKDACLRLNRLTITADGYREALEEVVPGIPQSSEICPPFFCDHGNGISIGERSFINYNCTILDGAYVTIGNDVKIGPNCQIYTPQHPLDFKERRGTRETSYPVTIGDDTWLGGGVIVCPGVNIGRRCVIGAGSVVVDDIPDDSMAVGVPARVIRKLNGEQ